MEEQNQKKLFLRKKEKKEKKTEKLNTREKMNKIII